MPGHQVQYITQFLKINMSEESQETCSMMNGIAKFRFAPLNLELTRCECSPCLLDMTERSILLLHYAILRFLFLQQLQHTKYNILMLLQW